MIIIILAHILTHYNLKDYKKAKNIKEMAVCLDRNILIIILNNGHYIVMDTKNLIEYQDSKRNNKNTMIPMNKTRNADRVVTWFKPPYYRFCYFI